MNVNQKKKKFKKMNERELASFRHTELLVKLTRSCLFFFFVSDSLCLRHTSLLPNKKCPRTRPHSSKTSGDALAAHPLHLRALLETDEEARCPRAFERQRRRRRRCRHQRRPRLTKSTTLRRCRCPPRPRHTRWHLRLSKRSLIRLFLIRKCELRESYFILFFRHVLV
jgi:hypothetical protein